MSSVSAAVASVWKSPGDFPSILTTASSVASSVWPPIVADAEGLRVEEAWSSLLDVGLAVVKLSSLTTQALVTAASAVLVQPASFGQRTSSG